MQKQNPRTMTDTGRKRYNLSFNQKRFEAFQNIFASVGSTKEVPGLILDNFVKVVIERVKPELEKAEASGQPLGLSEVLALIDMQVMQRVKKTSDK